MRKIFGPSREGDAWRRKYYREIRGTNHKPDVAVEAKPKRL